MFTRKDFLTGGIALAAAGGVRGAAGATRPAAGKAALVTPDVTFSQLSAREQCLPSIDEKDFAQ